VLCLLAACGDDGGSGGPADARVYMDAPMDFMIVDAPATNNGFRQPTMALQAYIESSPGVFTTSTLDLTCLGVTRVDTVTTQNINLAVTVADLQNGGTVATPAIAGFDALEYTTPFSMVTGNSSGIGTLALPQGTGRFGISANAGGYRQTFTLDLIQTPTGMNQARTVRAMSTASASTYPALVGQTQANGEALILGRLYDCQQHPIANFIATLSSSSGFVNHVPGVSTYYTNASTGLPASQTSRRDSDPDGRYMILHAPATPTAYLQMWGYPTSLDLTNLNLRLLAELPITITADGVFITEHDPRAVP
jgi:hypothetical protein